MGLLLHITCTNYAPIWQALAVLVLGMHLPWQHCCSFTSQGLAWPWQCAPATSCVLPAQIFIRGHQHWWMVTFLHLAY